MRIALPLEGGIILLFFLAVSVTSFYENETRAGYLSLLAGFLLSLPFLLPFLSGLQYPLRMGLIISTGMPLFLIFLFFPFRGRIAYRREQPRERFDERDTLFSRRDLVPGTRQFEEYYARRPGNKPPDNKFRRKPGLLKAGTTHHDPILFAAANSIFDKVEEELHPRVEGEPSSERIPFMQADPGQISNLLLDTAVNWGVHSAGITELQDYHVYSVGGRGERYGVHYTPEHAFAIALTVEMDYDMMRAAPAAPTVLESARQYLQSGLIAVQLAEFIRSLGFPARAHIDGNYTLICPLVARDAGLGEIGRMGLLMTPRLGPRCRIAVVSTDLTLVPGLSVGVGLHSSARPGKESSAFDKTLIDFCRHCEKCARVCPARSIPVGPEALKQGIKRWKIDAESCYTYWCQVGTDCGRCMIVCPFSHPDNWFHRLVRFGIRNSLLFRRMALPLDDLFYGRRPVPRKPG